MHGSWWSVLTKCGPLGKGMANHFSILALRTSWTAWNGLEVGVRNTCHHTLGSQAGLEPPRNMNLIKGEGSCFVWRVIQRVCFKPSQFWVQKWLEDEISKLLSGRCWWMHSRMANFIAPRFSDSDLLNLSLYLAEFFFLKKVVILLSQHGCGFLPARN